MQQSVGQGLGAPIDRRDRHPAGLAPIGRPNPHSTAARRLPTAAIAATPSARQASTTRMPRSTAAQVAQRQPPRQAQATGTATRPSAMRICRSQRSASVGIMGNQQQRRPMLGLHAEQQIHHDACQVPASRLPVGSSASSSRGAGAKARASATRCCSPPDNCPGKCVSRWPRPTERRLVGRPRLAASCASRQLQRDRRRFPAPSWSG